MTKIEKNIKCRYFSGVLYPDDIRYNYSYSKLKEMDSLYILHNKDVDEVGEIKKDHLHFIVKNENAIYRSALAKDLNIPEEYICPITKNWIKGIAYFHNIKEAELYLIHAAFKDRDKYQYPISDIQYGCNKKFLEHCINTIRGKELSSAEKADIMYTFIRSSNSYISKFKFLDYAKKNDCFIYVNSKWYFWNDILAEHNYNYSQN